MVCLVVENEQVAMLSEEPDHIASWGQGDHGLPVAMQRVTGEMGIGSYEVVHGFDLPLPLTEEEAHHGGNVVLDAPLLCCRPFIGMHPVPMPHPPHTDVARCPKLDQSL